MYLVLIAAVSVSLSLNTFPSMGRHTTEKRKALYIIACTRKVCEKKGFYENLTEISRVFNKKVVY